MTAAPANRSFATFSRGENAALILATWRNRLRASINPVTSQLFTEDEIAAATADFTRWANGADATDLVLLASQARALTLADQVREDRANTEWLRNFHAVQTGVTPRPASGGSGPVAVSALSGTTFVGSTDIGDPAASTLTDEAGLRYQVLYTVVIGVSGTGEIEVVGIDTGPKTNLRAGAKLKPASGPIGFSGPGIVSLDFRGGNVADTDAVIARRVRWRKRHKQGGGNAAQFRAWAEDASSAVGAAFIYPCALEAGTTLVSVLQTRGTVKGPTGRVPSVGTLAAVRARIVPPGSPDVPGFVFVDAVGFVATSVDLVSRLAMPRASNAGWESLDAWPGTNDDGDPVTITTLTTQTNFRITIPSNSPALPAGVTQPSLMAWNASLSRFELLKVQSVVLFAGSVYTVTLAAAPSVTLAVGTWISPGTEQADTLGETVEAYFDSLGPGEVVELDETLVGSRAQRFPLPTEEFPQRAGSAIETFFDDALGSALSDRDLPYVSTTTPAVPADPALGPGLLVPGKVAVYALD